MSGRPVRLEDPVFPPLLTGHRVPESGDAFQIAVHGAIEGKFGAGDFIWSQATSRVDCAIVLEPEVPLKKAAEIGPLAMVAAGDALGAIGPPNLAITYRWPFSILANGATVGQVRIAVAADNSPDSVPERLILGMTIKIRFEHNNTEPGQHSGQTALFEEGCGDLNRTVIIESFARHFLTWIDTWETDGFRSAHELWRFRAHDMGTRIAETVEDKSVDGTMTGLDEHGGVLIAAGEGTIGIPLTDRIEVAVRYP